VTFTASIGNFLFSGAQEAFKAAEQIKEFMSPEDLQIKETNEEVI
jgi:hypothetical protein